MPRRNRLTIRYAPHMPLTITSNFDSGAIEVIRADRADDLHVRIRNDSHAPFAQWFHFRLSGARGTPCVLTFDNASQSSYPRGWEGYNVAASYDHEHWFRLPSTYDGTALQVRFTPTHDTLYFAYFEPYSWERHLSFLGEAQRHARVEIRRLGSTVEGRDLDLIVLPASDPNAQQNIWLIARQHPGETMAEWFAEGFTRRLLDTSDPVATTLRQRANFYIVPNMNPDGSVRGNLRTNATGANLNREWSTPSLATSPEVFHVRQALHDAPPTMFFDAHGDEGIPYNFVSGCEMLPGISAAQKAIQQKFIDDFVRASPDFQTQYGYSAGRYSTDALKLASKYIGHTFGCLSLTLEMPFKDNDGLPNKATGWNGARSKTLGAAMVGVVLGNL